MKQSARILLLTQLTFLCNAFVNQPTAMRCPANASPTVASANTNNGATTTTKLYFFDFLKQDEPAKDESKEEESKEEPEFDEPADKIFNFFFGAKEEEPMVRTYSVGNELSFRGLEFLSYLSCFLFVALVITLIYKPNNKHTHIYRA